MLGLKRNLFVDIITGLVPDELKDATRMSNRSGSVRQPKIPREKPTSVPAPRVDSLAAIPERTRGDKSTLKAKKNHRSTSIHPTQNSILVGADSKENISINCKAMKRGKMRQSKRRKRGTAIQTSLTEHLEMRKRSSNGLGGCILTSTGENGRARNPRRMQSLKAIGQSDLDQGGILACVGSISRRQNAPRARFLTRKVTRSSNLAENNILASYGAKTSTLTTKVTRSSNLPNDTKKTTRRNQISKNNGDCLLLCRAKTSTKNNSLTSKHGVERSCFAKQSTAKDKPNEKESKKCTSVGTKRTTKRKTKCVKRLVSPLGTCFHSTSIHPLKDEKFKSSPQTGVLAKRDVNAETLSRCEIPPLIYVSIPPQSESSVERRTSLRTKSNSKHEESEKDSLIVVTKGRKRRLMGHTDPTSHVESQPERNNTKRPLDCNETDKKSLSPKYSIGTCFQKSFRHHGYFSGTITAFDSKTGFYSVSYEDGDFEELEESELSKSRIQQAHSVPASIDQKTDRAPSDSPDKERKGKIEFESSGRNKISDNPNEEGSIPSDASSTRHLRTNQRRKHVKNKKSNEPLQPLRRSRRLSSENTERIKTESSLCLADETNKLRRRSKRRRSQPERLIDSSCVEDKQTRHSQPKKKRKAFEEKPKAKAQINEESREYDDLVSETREGSGGTAQQSPHKQYIVDTLGAMMPFDKTKQLECDSDVHEDDIFDSTPMRALFSNNFPKDEKSNNEIVKERRSKRKSIEPERYGKYAGSPAKVPTKPVKSALKKKKFKRSSKAKKKVRISNSSDEMNVDTDSLTEAMDPWTETNVKALHKAHRTVDPTSFSFWEDVADIVGQKSATDCREKWFSLAKTPEPKRTKPKNNTKHEAAPIGNPTSSEDDIFNSTPMRSAFGIGGNNSFCALAFEEIGDVSNMNVGSTIKIQKIELSDELPPLNKEPTTCPHGYKTYLQKMGRNMRQKTTRKKHVKNSNENSLRIGKKLSECVNEGDVEVKCKLSPGGTLRVDTYGDTDTEDYFDYEDEEE